MRTVNKLYLRSAVLVGAAACGSNTPGNSGEEPAAVDAPAESSDAAVDALLALCAGGDQMVLAGAWSLDTKALAVITVAGKATGINGSHMEGGFFLFSTRSLVGLDLEALGTHDISAKNLKYLQKPNGASCATPGTCAGFFATGGSYTVGQVHPRYQATFTLTDLFQHNDSGDTPGAPIAGTITGCVDVMFP
jgi:hypothetical protein